MAYYLYKKIKASREASKAQPSNPLSNETKPACPHVAQSRHAQVFNPTEGNELRDLASISLTGAPRESQPPRSSTSECAFCKEEVRRRRIYRWKVILGLFLPYMLATIDLTIVATAVPSIASHFGQLNQLSWIITAFTLTSTTFIPTFGQLADVFGRHATLQVALFLMLIGSTLCAAAQTWGMLLFGRALQGMSSAGLMNIIMIILADRVSLNENAKNNSIFAFVGGVGYSIGPVVGGYLTDANWRYCFVISIAIAFASHIIIHILLRNELVEGTYFRKGSRRSSFLPALATLDFGGAILFILGVGLIVLGISWGGSTYPWKSAKVLAPLVVGGICFVLFFVYEYLLEQGRMFARIFPSQSPMLPYSLFSRLDTLWLAVLQFATGAAMYSVFYYVGVYFTIVEDYATSKSGVQLLFYIPGLGAGVYIAMFMCNIRPAQTFFPLTLGTFLETAGLAVMTWGIHAQKTGVINAMMVIAGAGTGIRLMPGNLHAAGVWPDRIAAALSLMRFAQPFGGTVSISIMGSVYNNKLGTFGGLTSGDSTGSSSTDSLSAIDSLPSSVQVIIRSYAREAIMWAYISILPILGISVITGLFLGNVWINKRKKSEEVESNNGTVEDDSYSEVIYVPYLYALFTKGSIERHKHISRPVQHNTLSPDS
ncbi:hypothetical protein AOCH_003610 [Aspergillus ochraceoroseus]|uniref:Major facilitator superfamily (MFS) profile domain-containing protein n=1 Tax=Aspergillus ochraceoroseus TaxID=138278 RepID=A0A0F8WPU1_9EURO|nr:hypothetical protein AOCH_003610 [Aspergillus ochraceoroseus]